MPGIFGIISKRPKDINQEELNAMSKSVCMEACYNSGKYTLEDMGCYIGWTCHKESFSDCMPITNEKGDVILLYFGENFKDAEEIDELKGRNHIFNKWNASYLVHMYEEWGESFLVKLNGLFQGILIDKRNDKIILFNDMYGMQRMYYFEKEDAFYFSAEAKAILNIQPQLRQIETVSLAELFTYNCVLDNRSLFKNIYLLPGGSCWIFYGGRAVKKNIYFEPSDLRNQPLLEKEFYYDRLKDTCYKIVQRYLRSKSRIGMFLNGSFDCKIILSNTQYGTEKLSCYTFGSIYGDTDDVKMARSVADAAGQTLNVMSIDEEFFNRFHELAERTIYISEGNMDTSGAADLYLNQMAREIAPIQLTSNYGGIFLRKEGLIHLNNINRALFNDEFQNMLNGVREKYDKISSMGLIDNLNQGFPWAVYGELSIKQTYLNVRTPFTDNDLVKLMYRAPFEVLDSNAISFRLKKDGNPLFAGMGIDRGIRNPISLLNSLLTRIYSKLLFGTEKFISYGVPNRMPLVKNYSKRLEQKKILLQPQNINHFRVWYRDELSNYLKEILLDERSLRRSYINKAFLEHIVTMHTKGINNYTNEINKVLTAEYVHRLFIDG